MVLSLLKLLYSSNSVVLRIETSLSPFLTNNYDLRKFRNLFTTQRHTTSI